MIKINNYIKVLEDLKITQSDFIFLYCTYNNKPSILERYKNLFPTDDNTIIGQRNIDLLIDKELLYKTKNGNYKTTKSFNKYFINLNGADEIYKLYPSNLKTLNKFDFKVRYNEELSFNLQEHKTVKQCVNFALKHNIELPNIDVFLSTQFWEEIKKIKKNMQKKS